MKRSFSTVASTLCPTLCVVIDTEEEFDWAKPLCRDNRAVTSIQSQGLAQEIFARYGIVPTYVVDHPVASDRDAVATLKGFLDTGACEIGAHLHPWVNPPHEETVCPVNSYAGNLPESLERRKLTCLTETIEASFAIRPTVYKAGRYGIGPNTGRILEDLGYTVDASVVPFTSFTADGGPDFSAWTPEPARLGKLTELPVTAGFAGALRRHGPKLYPRLFHPWAMRAHGPGIFARGGLLERIRLTPEGVTPEENIRLVRALLADGWPPVFSYSYHSPSLAPGNTPYVRTAKDRQRFLDDLDRFFDFFFNTLKGTSATATQLHKSYPA